MGIDFSEVRRLAADLRAAPAEALPFVRKALQVTAHHIKDDWRAGANRSGLGGYAADITYEMRDVAGGIEAEIGPTPDGDQGAFGFVEDAPGGVRSAPQHAARDALERNEEDFLRGIERALADGIEKALGAS